MPWHISRSAQCPADKPFAVIKNGTSTVEGCHESEEKARRQLAALYASEGKAELSTESRNRLPDSAFACPEKRLYPHHTADGSLDLPHLRNALARVNQAGNDTCGKAHLEAHAKAEGMGDRSTKALLPIKAQILDTEELDAWLAGKHPRRLLAMPFGGPIPSPTAKAGVDLDGHYFDEATDIYGPYKVLRENRERLVDWHHSYVPPHGRQQGPLGGLTGSIIGKAVLDQEPDEEGWWVDFWVKAGQKKINLIRTLAERGAQLFGSSQIIPGSGKINFETGHIERWPMVLETLTTSPQNTYSAFRSAKAMLDEADEADIHMSTAIKALLTDLDNLGADLPMTLMSDGSFGDDEAKAGRVLSARNERELRELVERFLLAVNRMVDRPSEPPTEGDASTS